MVNLVTNHLGGCLPIAYAIHYWLNIQDGLQGGLQPWNIDTNGPSTDDLLSDYIISKVAFASKLLE